MYLFFHHLQSAVSILDTPSFYKENIAFMPGNEVHVTLPNNTSASIFISCDKRIAMTELHDYTNTSIVKTDSTIYMHVDLYYMTYTGYRHEPSPKRYMR